MVIAVPQAQVTLAMETLRAAGEDAYVIGSIKAGADAVEVAY
jgi:phosphoribosylaminoimidazole (AIR) synthetase